MQDGAAITAARADVAVIGAGQAGLSAAYHLRRRGLEPGRDLVVLDADAGPGGAWQHRWPSLTMADAHRVHELPGAPPPDADPAEPASSAIGRYFGAYEEENGLAVIRPVRVRAVREADPGPPRRSGRLLVEADDGRRWSVRALVNATGTWTRPFWPYYPGRETFAGRQLHTHDFREAGEFAGRHVVVVGGGTSALQLLLQIARVASTTWVTRRPPAWIEGEFSPELGRAAVARVAERTRAGLPPESVVSATGLPLTPAYRAGIAAGVLRRLPMFERIVPDGVVWSPGARTDGMVHQRADVILWATGFRAALDHLAPLDLREPGGGVLMDGTQAVRDPRVQLVGYGPSASTIGAHRAGREAARRAVEHLTALS